MKLIAQNATPDIKKTNVTKDLLPDTHTNVNGFCFLFLTCQYTSWIIEVSVFGDFLNFIEFEDCTCLRHLFDKWGK